MNNNVEEIKARLNIVDVIGEYVRLNKAGTNWKGLCPFHHEKSPSFMVNEEKQIFHCFGCAKGGDVFTFVQEIESMEFREVLKLLAEKAGVELQQYAGSQKQDDKKRILEALELATKFYETQLWKGVGKDKILGYLSERALSEDSIRAFRLGYAPDGWRNILNFLTERGFTLEEIEKTGLLVRKADSSSLTADNCYDRFRDRIMFPITDILGNVIGYSARVAPGADESQAKYINTPETPIYHKSKALYGIFHAKQEIKQKDSVLLVEGNMDVIAAHQAGIRNTVAVSGTALTPDQVTALKRYSGNILMLFDMDSAGQKAAQRSADLCLASGVNVKVVTLSEGKDASDAVQKDPELLLKAVREAAPVMEYFFAQALKKHDKNDAEGKRQISKEVLLHVAQISNAIEKSHWIKKIAHELDVEEKVIGDVLQAANPNMQQRQVQPAAAAEESASFLKHSDVIRNSLVGLIMSDPAIWKETAEQESTNIWAQEDKLIRFVFEKGTEAGFSLDNLLFQIKNDQARERLRKIGFDAKYRFSQDQVIEYSPDDLRALIGEHLTRYLRELQKEKLHAIMRQIADAEKSGNKALRNELLEQHRKISQELA